MTDILFQPVVINKLEVKNRIYMPAMHMHMARNYEVTDRLIAFYTERARGGAGLITVGYATVDEWSGNPGNIGAHRDDYIPGLSRLAAAIKENGARASVQLNHAGRYNHSMLMGGRKPVAPSPLASRLTREEPEELDLSGIRQIIAAFAAAADRARQAGFDAVEILAGTGYLISSFLSPLTNKRTDDYGGSFENRVRFGREVVAAIRTAVGPSFPLLARLNGNDFMQGGSSRAELQEFAILLEQEGVDAICVNVGWHEARVPQIASEVPRGIYGYLARGIKARVQVPVIASHRINDPAVARQLLSDGVCDMVALGRALIADPYFPEKARMRQEGQIVHCVACGQGCFDNLFRMKGVECLCNPRAGHELERHLKRAADPRKVLVIGGGVAGMSAALAAAECGHRVKLFEKSARLGGQLHLAGAPPGREEFSGLAHDLEQQLAWHGVQVQVEQQVDQALFIEQQPDLVILATGGLPIVPPIPGVGLAHVVQAWQVLAGSVEVGHRVVVVGGGAVGVETALLLAEEGTLSGDALKFLLVHGAETPEELYRLATRGTREVVMVELLDELGRNFGRTTRWGMLLDVEKAGITTMTETRVREITPACLIVEKDGKEQRIAADTVVLAVGTQAYNPLEQIVAGMEIPFRVVGDAAAPGMVFDAMHQGFEAVRQYFASE